MSEPPFQEKRDGKPLRKNVCMYVCQYVCKCVGQSVVSGVYTNYQR